MTDGTQHNDHNHEAIKNCPRKDHFSGAGSSKFMTGIIICPHRIDHFYRIKTSTPKNEKITFFN
jgi:hypothetical protein